ncbi:MAG: DUF2934 domain-containing protein [Hydrogenothermaceae bacterium]|nr:DUF2934 domain-containing protein [Hydrogenothermaceae bacterium]
MEREELIRIVAEKIWEITGKRDDRTLQNWYDAVQIVELIESKKSVSKKRSSGRKSKKI